MVVTLTTAKLKNEMKRILILVALVALSAGCCRHDVEPLNADDFVTEINGQTTGLYTIHNANGATVEFTDYGARIVSLWVPDKQGGFRDVVLGYPTIKAYLDGDKFAGPVVGRYGNRIAKGSFLLDSTRYQLTTNENGNQLHGGNGGWWSKVWTVVDKTENSIQFAYYSLDGEDGYPGNVNITVMYLLDDENQLFIEYGAISDRPTVINPTSHCYFNLHGDTRHSTNSHLLKINAQYYTPTDVELIPTGAIEQVKGTPLDFTEQHAIGERIDESFEALTFGHGYDHNFVLDKDMPRNDWGMTEAATVYEPRTGIVMTILTNQPALQFYSGNLLMSESVGKHGNKYNYRTGIALETQNFPDAPNHDNFPSSVLRPGDEYSQRTIYRFDVRK